MAGFNKLRGDGLVCCLRFKILGFFCSFSIVARILVARDLQAGFVSNHSLKWKVKILTLNALMVQMQIVVLYLADLCYN